MFFKAGLGNAFTEPSDAPDLSQFRLVDMFTSCSDQQVKDNIIKLFTSKSQLRIVIATVTFGMGIDCPDVCHIIHYGPPDDLESNIQETGRAGRDGKIACATLLVTKGYKRYTNDEMHKYVKNDTMCRRVMLFSQMEGYHAVPSQQMCLCCDVCQLNCSCGNCISV